MPLKKTSAAALAAVGLFALSGCGSVLQSDDVYYDVIPEEFAEQETGEQDAD